MASILKLIKNPAKLVYVFDKIGISRIISDKVYLKLKYKANFEKKLNLKDPKTFNEKMQWLKLYDRNPEYTNMVDKYEAKKYVANRIGEEYIIPTLGVWDRVDDIDFDSLPDQFVLKCTHDSGGVVICQDKNNLNKEITKNKLRKSLNRNFYHLGREWPYKNVSRKIIAEKYMEDSETKELRDYKFFCFNGKVKCFKVDFDRFTCHRANYFSLEKELLPFGESAYPPNFSRKLSLPQSLSQMIEFAEILSADVPFLRVDFYDVDNQIYFGELTFFPFSGFGKFEPQEWDHTLGDWIKLKNN